MKFAIFLICLTLLLFGCTTSHKPKSDLVTPIDLTFSREEAKKYWSLAKPVAPVYPQSEVERKITGCSRFKITISSSGDTVDIQLIESFPTDSFSMPALRALEKWKWEATRKNASKQAIIRIVQVDFYMEDALNYEKALAYCSDEPQF
ncbi:energy transducer TonB [Alteromonas flava]|uniref:energy transducer TonB n=1 Tax=Alteromonas flava TaxID=2048003 RepID=UPI0013DAD555|nr:energy transducer TonB [Alteromonas flava]